MEYSRSFAALEALVLLGFAGWLFYLNSRSARSDSDRDDGHDADDRKEGDGRS